MGTSLYSLVTLGITWETERRAAMSLRRRRPTWIMAATRALNQGNGVLYLYGNYAGDNLNFDMAAEMAAEEGIRVDTIRVWDDVASAPLAQIQERRGIAGDLFVIKIAGAVSATVDDLAEVSRVTAKARDHTRSMGVAVAAGSIPETGEPTFELGLDEIEIGMGMHGEPGVSREKLLPADRLVEKMMAKLIPDLPFRRGDRVCLLINDLGRHHHDGTLDRESLGGKHAEGDGGSSPRRARRQLCDLPGDGRVLDYADETGR